MKAVKADTVGQLIGWDDVLAAGNFTIDGRDILLILAFFLILDCSEGIDKINEDIFLFKGLNYNIRGDFYLADIKLMKTCLKT
jgi:hypothetical protein